MQDVFYAVDKMLYDKLPSHRVQCLMAESIDVQKPQIERDILRETIIPKCRHHALEVDKATKELLSIVVFNRRLIHLENICLLCLNLDSAKDLLTHGIIPFPYKVAKALDSSIYRNIEYDVWVEKCKGDSRFRLYVYSFSYVLLIILTHGLQIIDRYIVISESRVRVAEVQFASRYDGTSLQVGVKCLCRLEPAQSVPYHCHIQQLVVDGSCSVFVEELGERREVPYSQLEALPRDQLTPWAPPYRLSRTHSQLLTVSQILQQLG